MAHKVKAGGQDLRGRAGPLPSPHIGRGEAPANLEQIIVRKAVFP
jgi:hypothetical protein